MTILAEIDAAIDAFEGEPKSIRIGVNSMAAFWAERGVEGNRTKNDHGRWLDTIYRTIWVSPTEEIDGWELRA